MPTYKKYIGFLTSTAQTSQNDRIFQSKKENSYKHRSLNFRNTGCFFSSFPHSCWGGVGQHISFILKLEILKFFHKKILEFFFKLSIFGKKLFDLYYYLFITFLYTEIQPTNVFKLKKKEI